MSNACTPVLVGMTPPVSEIWLPFNNDQISPLGHGPWSSKILIDWNRLKNFMQVEMDVKCMHTSFGGHDLSSFGDTATLKNSQISLLGHGLAINSPWSSKNLIDRNRLKKFMQLGVDVTCMHTSFGGRDPSGFGDMATFQKRPNFPFGAWTSY